MEELYKILSTLPPEAKGAIYMWLGGVALAGLRWVGSFMPAGAARSWLEGLDWIAHFLAANSTALGQRIAPPKKVKP